GRYPARSRCGCRSEAKWFARASQETRSPPGRTPPAAGDRGGRQARPGHRGLPSTTQVWMRIEPFPWLPKGKEAAVGPPQSPHTSSELAGSPVRTVVQRPAPVGPSAAIEPHGDRVKYKTVRPREGKEHCAGSCQTGELDETPRNPVTKTVTAPPKER